MVKYKHTQTQTQNQFIQYQSKVPEDIFSLKQKPILNHKTPNLRIKDFVHRFNKNPLSNTIIYTQNTHKNP